jgi:hypothetical protein
MNESGRSFLSFSRAMTLFAPNVLAGSFKCNALDLAMHVLLRLFVMTEAPLKNMQNPKRAQCVCEMHDE